MNYYAEVIDVVLDSKTSDQWKSIVVEIAKRHPKIVLDVVSQKEQAKTWRRICTELMVAGEKANAIKHCRAATGMGLHEAKDAVERLA